MNVWAISDLHLSFAKPERRERYAARWRDHATKIEQNWRQSVQQNDLVLLPGDISMARNHQDLQADLEWLHRLPGRKVLTAGNHDLWWNGATAIRPLLRDSIFAVDGDALELEGVVVCGTIGAAIPPEVATPRQIADAERELSRLEAALTHATSLRPSPKSPIYVLWHFPPFDGFGSPGPWVSCMEEAGVTACVYGHLHTTAQWSRAVQGNVRGVRYCCVAADAIGFRPLRIGPSGAPSATPRGFR